MDVRRAARRATTFTLAMKFRPIALATLVLTAAAAMAVISLRARGRGELDASAVLNPYLRRVQAGDFHLAIGHWAANAERRPTVESLREGWSARQQRRGTFERWRVAVAVPGGDVFTGESWVDARVWLYFADAPQEHVPVEWRVAQVEGEAKIVRVVVEPQAVGEEDAAAAF